MPGRYYDGWLTLAGTIHLWPERPGRLEFDVTLPPGGEPVRLRIDHPRGLSVLSVRPGEETSVSIPVCAGEHWTAEYSGPFTGSVGTRFVSVRSSKPVFRPDPRACN